MDIFECEDKLALLQSRHSVRSFSKKEIDVEILRELQADVTMINSHEAGFHFSLVTSDPTPFQKLFKSYGAFQNAGNFLACIVDTSFPHYKERGGYYAEQFAIKCTGLGLGTCFVGATYSPDDIKLQLRADWKLLFVVLFGYPSGEESLVSKLVKKMTHRKASDPRSFFQGGSESYEAACKDFPWLPDALEALACAPSSYNKHPVRIGVRKMSDGSDRKEVYALVRERNPFNLSDLGIAKFNMSVVMPPEGVWEWGNEAPFILE